MAGLQNGRMAALKEVHAGIITCERCPRLRKYCQQIGVDKRRAFRDDTYWARPVPGFVDPDARVLTGDGGGGSGDFLMSALNRAGFVNLTTSHHPQDGLKLRDAFILAAVRCAPPQNKPTPEEISNCLPHFDISSGVGLF